MLSIAMLAACGHGPPAAAPDLAGATDLAPGATDDGGADAGSGAGDAAEPMDAAPADATPPADLALTATLTIDHQPQYDFGHVLVNDQSAPVTLTVQNAGNATSGALGAAALTGADAGAFSITNDGCAGQMLAPGGSCMISVMLAPSAPGTPMATLTVSAAPGGSTSVGLTGHADTPAVLSFSQSSYSAPNPVDAGSSATLTLTLQNGGSQDSGALPSLVTSGDASFSVVAGGTCAAGSPVPGLGSCTILVRFAPSTWGTKSGGLSVSASPGGSASATLGGTGRQTFTLTVSAPTGNGSGTLSIDGTACASFPCTKSYAVTTTVPTASVTESPGTGSLFNGWGGACSGSGACGPTMSQNRTVTSGFVLEKFTVTVDLNLVRGVAGTVSSNVAPAMTCTTTRCTGTYDYGTNVTLTATPTGSALFQSWAASPCADRFNSSCATGALSADFSTSVTFRPAINYMFVSSDRDTISPAGLGGDVTVADHYCDTLARNAGLYPTPTSGTPYFKALLSTTTASAASRLQGAQGWIRPDGKAFANLPSELFSSSGTNAGQIFYPPTITETGAMVDTDLAMTGSNGTGALSSNCSDYSATSGAIELGAPRAGAGLWLDRQNNSGCNLTWHVYCFETAQPATAVAPIATTGARVAFVSAGTVAGSAHRDPASLAGSADALCAAEATAANLSGTFLSLMSVTGTSGAGSDRFSGTAPWARPDGTLIAASVANLMSWTNILAPIDQDASGKYATGYASVWLGSGAPNLAAPDPSDDCTDWSASSGSGVYMLAAGSLWDGYAWGFTPCTSSEHVFCLQQ